MEDEFPPNQECTDCQALLPPIHPSNFCNTLRAMKNWIECGIATDEQLKEYIELMQLTLYERHK